MVGGIKIRPGAQIWVWDHNLRVVRPAIYIDSTSTGKCLACVRNDPARPFGQRHGWSIRAFKHFSLSQAALRGKIHAWRSRA